MPLKTTHLHKEPLTWLFKAKFADEHLIEQDTKDTCHSRTDGSGSAFSDVLAYPEKLVGFGLYNTDERQYVWIDLITGNFIVNGTIVCAHNQRFDPMKYELELIYFRETKAQITQDQRGKVISTRHFASRYFLGWKTKVQRAEKQITLAVG